MALTELAIKNLKSQTKLYRVTDSGGLCLEISPAGGKLWRWRYYYQGKQQVLALGKYPLLTLAEARRKRDAGRILLEAGKNPSREKKAAKLRQAIAGENTFERVANHWITTSQHRLSPKSVKQNLSRLQQHAFPMVGGLPISEISIPDVVRVVERIGERGTVEMAKRVKQLMSQVFRYAAQRGLCTFNPAADLRGVLPKTQEKHFACVHPSELPALLNSIEAYNSYNAKMAMKLLAYTFVRTGELIGAKWCEIDWERQEWHIPKERMKMKRPHVVPLSEQVLTLLREQRTRTGERIYIFHSAASKEKHISNGIVLMALRRMGYRGRMTGHGFRTAASTILNEKGYASDVIERQLAHEDSDKIRAAYNRAEYMPERKSMMQDYADYLDRIKILDNENIVTLKAARQKRSA